MVTKAYVTTNKGSWALWVSLKPVNSFASMHIRRFLYYFQSEAIHCLYRSRFELTWDVGFVGVYGRRRRRKVLTFLSFLETLGQF